MARIIFCRKYQKSLEGLEAQPFPGKTGEDIYTNVSKQAWLEWQQQQTMLINEKQLKSNDPETRRYLMQQMKLFFSGDEHDTAEGYVPPNDKGE